MDGRASGWMDGRASGWDDGLVDGIVYGWKG